MADQQRWFKLWCSAPSDDDLQALPPALRWAWAALGCYVKEHGTHGSIKLSPTNTVVSAQMGVSPETLRSTILQLPHLDVHEEGQKCNGEFTVTFSHWHKYQEDNSLKRVTRFRERTNVTMQKRREEKRGEENKKPPLTPPGGFERFWAQYPKKVGKVAAEKVWKKLAPDSALVATILAAIARHRMRPSWCKDGGQFIPNPATWLNGRRWEDELESAERPTCEAEPRAAPLTPEQREKLKALVDSVGKSA